jgi:hypothetical protein
MTNKLEAFIELLKKTFTNKSSVLDTEIAPFYVVGAQFNFPKELIDLYVESLIISVDDSQIINEKYEIQLESEIDQIIESGIDIEDVNIIVESSKTLKNSNDFEELIVNEDITYKSKYLLAIWNKLYLKFSINNPAVHKLLISIFDVKDNGNIPVYKVYELYKTKNELLNQIINTPNGVGGTKMLELKKLLSSVIQEANLLDSYINENNLDKKVVDFLFKLDIINEKNINYLIEFKTKNSSKVFDFPMFWLFDLYLISISKNNENHYFIYKSILSDKDYSDEILAELCNLSHERVRQLRADFLLRIPDIINDFRIKLGLNIFEDKLKELFLNYSSYELNLLKFQSEQNIKFRISFCNVLLSCFTTYYLSSGEYVDLFRSKKEIGKKTITIHLLSLNEIDIYNEIIKEVEELSLKRTIRNLYNFKFDNLQKIESQYLKDIIVFELDNWSYKSKSDKMYIKTRLSIDFENNTITRVDVKNTGIQEFTEISDFVNSKNKFNTFYNDDLKKAFSENNEFDYKSRFNETFKRHLEQLEFVSIANKWIRKSYILQFVSDNIFNYKKCNFKDLIIELIKENQSKYNGKNTRFWLNELNEILQHNYPTINYISAILRDERVKIENGLIFLK